jgi:hypothetical protein
VTDVNIQIFARLLKGNYDLRHVLFFEGLLAENRKNYDRQERWILEYGIPDMRSGNQ